MKKEGGKKHPKTVLAITKCVCVQILFYTQNVQLIRPAAELLKKEKNGVGKCESSSNVYFFLLCSIFVINLAFRTAWQVVTGQEPSSS